MDGLISLIIVIFVVSGILGKLKGGRRNEEQRKKAAPQRPRSQAEMVEQQRQRATEYRRQDSRADTLMRRMREQAGANRAEQVALERREIELARREQARRAQQAAQFSTDDDREHPWQSSARPQEERRSYPAAQPQRQAAVTETASGKPRQTPPILFQQPTTDPLCAVPEAHTSPVPGREAAQALYSREELVKAIVMAEVLGPCKARKRR